MTSSRISHPLLVISYGSETRSALATSLDGFGVCSVTCASFNEAEEVARQGVFNGILVDLQSIIKAKGDEKIIACSLTGFYPTLRVRALGAMLVPMAMPGDARQDSSIADFLAKSCAAFTPRPLRQHKRKEVGISLLIRLRQTETRAFAVNLSWGGVFLVDMDAERFQPGDAVMLTLHGTDLLIEATVCWVRTWGERLPPGIGVRFGAFGPRHESLLLSLLKHDRDNSRDRMVAG